MPLTLFTTPKDFEGEFDRIQRNSLTSWTLIRPRPEIIVFGDARGTAGVCAELGLRHVPEIESNERGTPLVSHLFDRAQAMGSGTSYCYVNADIILLDDLASVITRAEGSYERYLIVGQRVTVQIPPTLSMTSEAWRADVRELAREAGTRDNEYYIDYFAFSGDTFGDIPPFAIGRAAYDNWLIWKALKQRAAVIDASDAVLAIHQAHGYGHVEGARAEVYEGPEAKRNLELAGGKARLRSILDATHVARADGRIVRAMEARYEESRRARKQARLRSHPVVRGSQALRHRLGIRRTTWEALLRFGKRLLSRR